jgi:hypothetical protein
MKCIRCGGESKYKERPNGICPHCKRKFAFEPRTGDPVTDGLFAKAIEKVSGDGKIRWGVEHLYYEVCRRYKGTVVPLPVIVVIGVLTAFFTFAGVGTKGSVGPFALIPLVLFIITCVAISTHFRGPYVRMDVSAFNRLWDRWKAVHGTPKSVIQRAPEVELPKHIEADLGDYSFDRAVICDRARTVDLLVANNFHFENNCAILTMDGYPKGPFAIIRKMLKKNPKLQVFVLHDASVAGCQLAHRLVTDPEWFGGAGLRVIDLGLRPRHAGPFRGLYIHGERVRQSEGDGLSADEAKWLEKSNLALAAARPEQVLKRLFAGLQAHSKDDPRQRDTSSRGAENGYVSYCGSFDTGGDGGSDASAAGDGAGDGGGDAFG